jgi:dihydrofolate synthase / folylpolyglutamate synthase
MNFESALTYLESFISYEEIKDEHYDQEKFDLNRIKKFLDKWKVDYSKLKFVHVAGSKGKGTVCDLIGKYLFHKGFNVGIFTSPHIVSVCERFWVNGEDISEENFTGLVQELKACIQDSDKLTYFEILFVLALKFFSDMGLEYVVVEVGLGGRLDATNIIVPELSIISTVELEHTEILGNTIEEIVKEKLGIVKEGVPVLIGYQSDSALEAVVDELKGKEKVYFMTDGLEEAKEKNMKLAFTAIRLLTGKINEENFMKVSDLAGLPGRVDVREIDRKIVVFDMAHTINSMKALRDFLNNKFKGKEFVFLFGMLKGKKVEEVLNLLKPLVSEITFTSSHLERGQSAKDLSAAWGGGEIESDSVYAFDTLLKELKKDQVLVVTGSHFLLSEIFIKRNLKARL